MTTITLNHVTKRFSNGVLAIDDLSMKIISGQVLAVLGPSGSGKSTLLRLIAGLMEPDSGEVLFNQDDLKGIDLQARNIGMVFQDRALMPHWDAEETIGFWSKLRGRQAEVPDRIRQVSTVTGVGIEHLLNRRPSQLSGGEQQRVAIARALARDLDVLLFDEPFANLDAKMRAEARVELKRLLNQFPATAIFVTHDQTEAIALSHRIAILRAGHLEQVGTYTDLYDRPVNIFVAEFIGTPTINLFRGRASGGIWQGENFGGYSIRSDLPDDLKVTMGIRPEYMRLKKDGVPAVVDAVTPFYTERRQQLDVWLGGESWRMLLPLDETIEVGSTIYCDLDPTGILYFNTRTGQRIG